jgi:hypothetical protein
MRCSHYQDLSSDNGCDTCSASNYLLGMTPLGFPAFLTGSLAGMSVWSLVYASLGGASRALLQEGVDPQLLLAGLPPRRPPGRLGMLCQSALTGVCPC